jgi:hypothetical protein
MFVVCGSAGALKAPGALLGIKGSLSVAAILKTAILLLQATMPVAHFITRGSAVGCLAGRA